MKKVTFIALFCLLTQVVFGAGLYVTTNPNGAKIERYNEATSKWVNLGASPRLFVTEQHEYVCLRVSAVGYTSHEAGYNTDAPGTTQVNVVLQAENNNPNKVMMFAVGGQVTSKSGKLIIAGMYKVLTRNMTTYRANAGQAVQDTNPLGDDSGWYTNTLADSVTNRAVAVGDRIFTGVFSYDMKRSLGYKYVDITEEDVNNAYVIMNVQIK